MGIALNCDAEQKNVGFEHCVTMEVWEAIAVVWYLHVCDVSNNLCSMYL